jgi:succinate-semialdehyde dehydrogenase/glutarate-semialdehyde dehydrogenase
MSDTTATETSPTGSLDTSALASLVTTAGDRDLRNITSPLDGSVIGHVPICLPDDVDYAASVARDAQKAWAATPLARRCAIANRFRSLLLARRDDMLDLLHADNGKSRINGFEELLDTALTAGYYAQHAPNLLADKPRMGAIPLLTSTIERYVPVGLVGVISPWNYPLTLAVSDAIAAIIAGNAVILKPDSETPLIALAALQLLREAGLPAGVFQVVTGSGRLLGTPLIDNVDFLMFTGSSQTGRTVAAECAGRLIGVSAELGGKNPLIILDNVTIDKAATGAVQACFSTTGQLCVSIERIYVPHTLMDAFVDAFAAKTADLRLGAGKGWDVDLGPLVTASHLDKVAAHVDDAVAKGATVRAGGRPRPDLGPTFYEPTILTGVPDSADLYRGETFGPVVAVYGYRTIEEAIHLANDTEYGLNASVWGSDLRQARAVARQLRAGTVNVNEGYCATWGSHGAPIGGMGASGIGRRHGREGIIKYCEAQTISTQHVGLIGPPPGLSRQTYAQVMAGAAGLLRRLPVGLGARLVSAVSQRV